MGGSDGKTVETRPGWVLGPALLIFGALFWALNALALHALEGIYRLSSIVCTGALVAGLAALVTPGPRFTLTREQARDLTNVAKHMGLVQWIVWPVAFALGAYLGATIPETIFAPWR